MGDIPTTESYKGVRDFYPEDMYVERFIFDTMSRVAESFGYREYSASILEPAELYRSKTSDEIVNEQTYTFTDRGGREVTLRPEMTPTITRMVAARKQELTYPLRWFSIPNVFRYERPQRGRLREHWQLNADIFGVSSTDAEAEIITLAHSIMKAFGSDESDFEIKINDRAIIDALLEDTGISEDVRGEIMLLLDKQDKISDFKEQLTRLIGEKTTPFITQLQAVSSSARLEELVQKLETLGVNNVVIDTSIVRGFNYYTGVVFEVFDTSSENNRSLFGGGRYDNLLELFGSEPIPAVGFGMGDVTMKDFLETHDLLPEYISRTDLFLATLTEDAADFAQKLAQELRQQDVSVEVSLSQKKVGEQIKLADKKKIPFVIAIGENEVAQDSFTIKHLASGDERTVSREDIATYIFEKGDI